MTSSIISFSGDDDLPLNFHPAAFGALACRTLPPIFRSPEARVFGLLTYPAPPGFWTIGSWNIPVMMGGPNREDNDEDVEVQRGAPLKGLTPYEFTSKQWTKYPERFSLNPLHQMPGLNT